MKGKNTGPKDPATPRGSFNRLSLMLRHAGVMEGCSNGVMQQLSKVASFGFLAFSNTPILQNSSTPKPLDMSTDKAFEIRPGQEEQIFCD
jgi:hypothetical protein